MSTIIAGLFDTGPRAADAKQRLRQAGVQETDMCEFMVNPPGQHAPIALPLAAGVGAYSGALSGTDEHPEREEEVLRAAGTMIAVNATSSEVAIATIARVMMECGPEEVERAEGSWNYGVWSDFDPLSIPQRIDMPPPIAEARRAVPPGP